MNQNLNKLHSYPFEKLGKLKARTQAPSDKTAIFLSLGEPKHGIAQFINEQIIENLNELTLYPTTKGLPELRSSIARWLERRFFLPEDYLDPDRHILPVSGTREALFSFAQCVVDPTGFSTVILPNPFYQIYEGAALMAGAEPYYLNCTAPNHYLPQFDSVPEAIWSRCRLLYLCSPGNPTGAILDKPSIKELIDLADRFDFFIASDECYSEIYLDEQSPPPGLLEAAYEMGNSSFRRCLAFNSLSKRSNAPGLRSGFVAGDETLIKEFYQYRTYHGCAMPIPFQRASIAAWNDETHVLENRTIYRDKFSAVIDILKDTLDFEVPQAGFFLWPQTPVDDETFALNLFESENVTVLPGSYLSRTQDGTDPGRNHARIALVQPLDVCIDAAHRISRFLQKSLHFRNLSFKDA